MFIHIIRLEVTRPCDCLTSCKSLRWTGLGFMILRTQSTYSG